MSDEKKFYEKEEFKQLDKAWKKKLKASGFKDLEDPGFPDSPIPRTLDSRTSRAASAGATLDYFDQALEYLQNGEFDSKRQKGIWHMHAYGESLRDISAALGISKTAVDYHIQKVKRRMQDGQY